MPKKAKAPKPPKLQRPKGRDLRVIYKGLLTVSLANRLASLAYALQWYDPAVTYLISKGKIPMSKDPLKPTPEQKAMSIAKKCRLQGIGAGTDHEKETSFLMAIRQYEKATAPLKAPKVDKFYDLFKLKKVALEKKQEKMEQKFGNITVLLQKAIGNKIKLTVSDAQKPVQYDPSLTTLNYNREAAKKMSEQFRKEGLLAVFTDQLEVFSHNAALEPNPDPQKKGTWVLDLEKKLAATYQLLETFVKFARTPDAPKKLIRFGVMGLPKAPKQPSANTGTKAPRASTKGPRILGFLVPGTAIATVYDRLKDELTHDIKDVIAGLTTSDPVGRVKQLGRYGQQKGCLTVTITGNKVQLKHAVGMKP